MVVLARPNKQQARELPRWKRILALKDGGLTKEEIASREGVGVEQVRRLLLAAEKARQLGWL